MALDQATINQVVEVITNINILEKKIADLKPQEPKITPTLEKEIAQAKQACTNAYNNMQSYTNNASYIAVAQPLWETYTSLIKQNQAIIEGNKPIIEASRAAYEAELSALTKKLEEARTANANLSVNKEAVVTDVKDMDIPVPVVAEQKEEPLEG